jgi:hypothetical protein
MAAEDFASGALDALKASILQSAGLAADTHFKLIPDPANQQIVCRVEVLDFVTRKQLIERFGGIAIGGTVYFNVRAKS